MPDLYVSMLGAPFSAVIAHSGPGRAFVKFGDRADNDFALDPFVWIDSEGAATGAQAAFLERSGHFGEFFRVSVSSADEDDGKQWSTRDLLAILLRRILTAAELQSGESVQRVTLVVPAALLPEHRSRVTQAALLAGAQRVELVSIDQIVRNEAVSSTAPGRVAMMIEAWDDILRTTTVDLSDASTTCRLDDLSATLSSLRLREMLLECFGSACDAAFGNDIINWIFSQWASGKDASHGITVTRAVAGAAPVTVHVPASALKRLADTIADRFDRYFKGHDIEAEQIAFVGVVGSWTRPIAESIRSLVDKRVVVRDERGTEIDAAIRMLPPQARVAKASLSSDILAVPETGRTLRALSQGDPITLLPGGSRLPATSVLENFRSNSFIGRFSIVAKSEEKTVPVLSIAIPRYAERQQSSYLRTVVHSETPDFILLEAAYLYSTQRRFSIYDRSAGVSIPIEDHIFRVIRG